MRKTLRAPISALYIYLCVHKHNVEFPGWSVKGLKDWFKKSQYLKIPLQILKSYKKVNFETKHTQTHPAHPLPTPLPTLAPNTFLLTNTHPTYTPYYTKATNSSMCTLEHSSHSWSLVHINASRYTCTYLSTLIHVSEKWGNRHVLLTLV